MTLIRAQVSMQYDTAFPRDAMVITPCFKTTQLFTGPDYDGLAQDLATAVQAWHGGTTETIVKLYDIEDPPPSPPKALKKAGSPGAVGSSLVPRDVALCLSFFSGSNTPRRRGRLYLPATWVMKHTGGSGVGPQPTTSEQNAGKDLAQSFASLGGLNVDWIVYSQADNAGRTVSNAYVDNEWDTQRRRGLKATSRVAWTTSG